MSKEVKISGKEGLSKDLLSGAIINTDDAAFRAARQTKKRILESIKKEREMEDRIKKLEDMVSALINKEKE